MQPRRTVAPVLGAILVVLVFAGTAVAEKYVALGDSYSSGTGTASYTLSSSCQRSIYAYPYLVSTQRANTQLTFVACSGAKTGDVLNNQVGSLTTDTAIVTITIGGNDAGFASVVTACTLGSCSTQITNARNYINNTLPGQLDSVYAQIRARAPSARVVVLGYPRLFSTSSCLGTTGIDSGERTSLNATGDLLNSVTAGRAAAAGFTFVNPTTQFTGHAICSGTAWLNGLNIFNSGESFHPNRNGHASGYTPLVRSVIG